MKIKQQQGQTLIETLVACFILVMGISAALGLAIYSLRATGSIRQQTVAMGLAREGLEVVKNMRDTNWLKFDIDTSCFNYSTDDNTAFCYKKWLDGSGVGGYDINPGVDPQSYSLRFDVTQTLPWSLVQTETDYGLNLSTGDGHAAHQVFYNGADGLDAKSGNSGYARKITITPETFAPFNHIGIGPRLKITSQVWWSGRDCTMTVNVNPDNRCSVTLETYLTNWRVF